MSETMFEKEKNAREKGFQFVVGVDEAGRGPLAGPVVAVAAAVRDFQFPTCLPDGQVSSFQPEEEEGEMWKLVRDSKTLSEKQRERAFEFVREKFFVGIGIVYPETIDRMNILEATFLAMKSALSELKIRGTRYEVRDTLVLVDGDMTIPNLSLKQEAIVDGDALVRSIAAASIVAKVTRDRMMISYDQDYPVYGFAKHKGYGTAAHMAALRRYGPCPIHRMSFKPVRDATVEGINKKLLWKKF